MTDHLNETNPASTDATIKADTWQLNALTAALGDLSLTISDSLSVGRGSDNDIVLGSKAVSRNHALLSVLNAELYVKDLDSSNGTFVNDERIEANKSVLLQAEDKLGFAGFDFQVVVKAQGALSESHPVAEELEELVGSVQEDFEGTNANADVNANANADMEANTVDTNPVVEPAVEPTPLAASDEEVIVENPIATSHTVDKAVSIDSTQEPVVKETIIGEVLFASAGVAAMSAEPVEEEVVSPLLSGTETLPVTTTEEAALAKEEASEPVIETPLTKEPSAVESVAENPVGKAVVEEEPLMHKEASPQEPVVTPEHDKTTTTELQEEADPDVLRAKQAATAQFSGTANLGQSRDLGTTGNNAMDQSISNPANTGVSEKKPSGGWFIWVFIAILIIGIALWLFNMGGA